MSGQARQPDDGDDILDSNHLSAAVREGARRVIVGAGWIGLEAAAAARTRGATVTVVESASCRCRVFGDETAEIFAGLHRAHGVGVPLRRASHLARR